MQRARDAFARSGASGLVTVLGALVLIGPLSCAELDDELGPRQGRDDDGANDFLALGCNPLSAGCPLGSTCHDVGGDPRFACVEDDPEQRPAGYGEACLLPSNCGAGLTCSPGEVEIGCKSAGYGCCAQYCDLDDGYDTCPGSQKCQPYFDSPPPAAEFLGLCR